MPTHSGAVTTVLSFINSYSSLLGVSICRDEGKKELWLPHIILHSSLISTIPCDYELFKVKLHQEVTTKWKDSREISERCHHTVPWSQIFQDSFLHKIYEFPRSVISII